MSAKELEMDAASVAASVEFLGRPLRGWSLSIPHWLFREDQGVTFAAANPSHCRCVPIQCLGALHHGQVSEWRRGARRLGMHDSMTGCQHLNTTTSEFGGQSSDSGQILGHSDGYYHQCLTPLLSDRMMVQAEKQPSSY